MPYTALDQNGLKTHRSLLEIPGPDLHPVLIARHMLQLAIFLQHLHPDLHPEIKGLPESPRAMMERLANLAINLVTTNDELLGSIEGLECVMIECMYQANIGNLRRSWVAGRRATSIAQLMGLHRPHQRAQYKVLDPRTKHDPQLMWLRIVFLDRNLCLMLGLPEASPDCSMASEELLVGDTPMGRLERRHCVIASRILGRNACGPSPETFALTRTLDAELQKAARSLPSKWWLAPNLDPASADPQTRFWDTRRLFAQVLHYNLLNQLHLPYMLRSSSSGRRKYEYSRITCVNASREVLSRFITLRRFNRIAYSCRTIDFLALMAAMTLLLAHLDSSQRPENENLLAHQYLSDRAMIEQAQENMREVNRLSSDALSAQSADLLERLLAIEIDAETVSVQETVTEAALRGPDRDQGDNVFVSVHIPYFGIIKIAREGMSKVVPGRQVTTPSPIVQNSTTTPSTDTMVEETQASASGFSGPDRISNTGTEVVEPMAISQQGISNSHSKTQSPCQLGVFSTPEPGDINDVAEDFTPQPPASLEPFLEHGGDPGLTAGGEDWAFQGVDTAFFESLMRDPGD